MTTAEYLDLIDSLLHCMADMDKGIGCDGCKAYIGGACDIDHLLSLLGYEALRRCIDPKNADEGCHT